MKRIPENADASRQQQAPQREPVYDVAIVGRGSAGATLANLLGAAGRSVLVLEREAACYPPARAIHFDAEVFRIFQSAGLREQVQATSDPAPRACIS